MAGRVHAPIPHIIRVKRKRTDDPLQALILEDTRRTKKLRPNTPAGTPLVLPKPMSYYQFTRTDAQAGDDTAATLDAGSDTGDARNFRLKAPVEPSTHEPSPLLGLLREATNSAGSGAEEVSGVLSTMVDSFLEDGPTSLAPQRKRRGRRPSDFGTKAPVVADYVYDVYQLAPLTSDTHPKLTIGYVQFFDDNANDLYPLEDDDSDRRAVLDDEDLNAELFYQNDYPLDEDAGLVASISRLSVGSDPDGMGNHFAEGELEFVEGVDYLAQIDSDDDAAPTGGFLDTPEQLRHYQEQYGGSESEGDSDFERQTFFKLDGDDPMAEHRDRIFGRLQQMIDE